MNLEERVEALERENKRLWEMLQKVAMVADYASTGTKFDRHSSVPYEVFRFSVKGKE